MKKGFTIIEMMVALAILTIILIALTHATVAIIRHNAYLEHKKNAIQIAQGTINYLSSLPYTHELLRNTQSNTSFINNPTPDPNGNGIFYLIDNGNGQYDGGSDIGDANDATNGIDHPSTGLAVSTYNDIVPVIKKDSITYYKIWGIQDTADWKKIVTVIYWFEGNNLNNLHFVSLSTIKRKL